jgi:hypothetical protein
MGKGKKREHDFAVNAFRVVQEATKEPEPAETKPEGKNPHAVALGRLGGLKGGKRCTSSRLSWRGAILDK